MSVIKFPPRNAAHVEARIEIITEIVRHVLRRKNAVSQHDLFNEVLEALGKNEEEIGREITTALFLLTRAPVLGTNTLNSQGADTVYGPGPRFLDYVFDEGMGFDTPEEDAE